ncbi:hypothetical protein LXL04_026265 [Taraxacum kok-saghyz]
MSSCILLTIQTIVVFYPNAFPNIIKTGFFAINLIYFFTVGPDDVLFFVLKMQGQFIQILKEAFESKGTVICKEEDVPVKGSSSNKGSMGDRR